MQSQDFKLAPNTWVLVADGQKALILENKGDAIHPNLQVVRELEGDSRPSREQGTDAPGRRADGGPGQRSALEETDWQRLAQDRFAKDAAELLYKQVHRQRYKHLVLVAAPRILGELRKELHSEVANTVIAEIPKDLTNHPIDEIERHLVA